MSIWFEEPAMRRWPNLAYLTHSQFFNGNWMFAGFIPSENIVNNLIPYLKPTATVNIMGWTSREVIWSFWWKIISQANIFSKLTDAIFSYLTALILLSADRIRMSLFVGTTQISRIFLVISIVFNTVCTGDLNVSTRVSYNSKLNMIGNIFPSFNLWFWIFCLIILS